MEAAGEAARVVAGSQPQDEGEPTALPDRALLAELVDANLVLFHQGVLDAFGHVSARHPARPDRFLLARNMAPGLVEEDDIVEFRLDGTPVSARGRRVYLERFIHGEIYRARPDVHAVVHSHSPAVVPFGVSRRARLRPICHMSGFLGAGAPVFEIRDAAGDGSDLLIRDAALGRALAQRLGDASIVLMRGHGSTVAAPTLRQVVYRAVYAEINAKLQLSAEALGEVEYLTEAEAAAACANIETQVERPWALWRERARAALGRA